MGETPKRAGKMGETPNPPGQPLRRHRVEHKVDAFAARRSAMDLARDLGFDRLACVEVAIATSELAVNIAKYGVRGEVTVEAVDHPQHGVGLVIVASDCGPPFNDFEQARRDGFDDDGPMSLSWVVDRHGLGRGLGAVGRFTDELTWEPTASGKRIRAVRYKKRPSRGS
jgi:anti-sigma regulatory factor (Ser/Thr protein kinase)